MSERCGVKYAAVAAIAILLAGCAGLSHALQGPAASALPVGGPAAAPASAYLSHVVVIIQENRTLENFFAGFPGANAPHARLRDTHNHWNRKPPPQNGPRAPRHDDERLSRRRYRRPA